MKTERESFRKPRKSGAALPRQKFAWRCMCGLFFAAAGCGATGAEPAAALRPWREYQTIMWVGDSAGKQPEKWPLFFQRLREMGITTAMVYGDADPRPLLDNRFPYYVENMINRGLCLKWNSKVRDWDKFVTDWARTGRPESALTRDYSLDDPQWRGWARAEMQRLARKHRDHQPLAYDIRDELSTTLSANPFDYDFGPLALDGFRAWLKTQYSSLLALNAEWDTRFASWAEVRPFTTDQIKNRMASGDPLPRGKPDWQQLRRLRFDPASARQTPARWNFSPWADFRTYMDLSLARTLGDLRQAAHEADPHTPVGIEGTQMPHAFGGYDLWRLAQVLDWVEPYDIGNAREVLGSFMPGKPPVTTVFERETNPARRRLWHLLLEGDRGCIVWWSEDCLDWKSDDYRLTPKAKALAPVLHEMSSPLARLFLRAERERDPIFIHYSQPSIQVDWLLESTVDGSTWLRRFSSYEAQHNRLAQSRNGWLKAFQDLGYSPQFIAAEEIERGQLPPATNAVIVLADSYALSEKEAAAIRTFLTSVGSAHTVFAEGTPGLFDEHGKLRARSPLEDFFHPTTAAGSACLAVSDGRPSVGTAGGGAKYAADRLRKPAALDWAGWIGRQLGPPEVSLPPTARVRIHRFRLGNARLLAFQRNTDYQMSEELKQAGGNAALEKPIEVEAALRQAMHLYDLRAQKYLGHTDRLRFTLDPWQPSLFALLPTQVPPASVVADLLNER
jgi:hypothetical protein